MRATLRIRVAGAGSEALLLHGALEKFLGIGSEFAEGPNLASAHLRIGVDLSFAPEKRWR